MSHIKNIKFLLLILCMIVAVESQCGDWSAYKDIKCFNIFESSGLQTYDDAINTCRGNNNESTLVTVNSADEQSFLTTFIFTTNHVVDNVWIGAKYVDNQYKWLNGLSLTYTNWAEGYPKNLTDYCVQVSSDPDLVGKWVDTSCKRKNLVVCEKRQIWTLVQMQERLFSLQETVTQLKQNESILHEAVNSLKQNIIPVGFIYVQFPNATTPQDIWSWMTWQEITSSYAGLFFRAFGGNSSSFGSTQEANAPRITQVKSEYTEQHSSSSYFQSPMNIPDGEWSKWLWTGSNTGQRVDISFFSSIGEVRPRNTAIRIWKRLA